jgi:hypothetical protein
MLPDVEVCPVSMSATYPGDEAVRERPGLQDAQVVAYFLQVRARKPAVTEG